MENNRPEDNLLLYCARARLDSEKADGIRALIQHEVDWTYLIERANRHGVMPLLYLHLESTCPEAVPKDVLERLRVQFTKNRLKNVFLAGELLKLLDLFKANDVPALSFKGPILAVSVYGDLALRQFSDLDILVRAHDIQKAKELLVSHGYRSQFHLNEAQENAYLRSNYYYHNLLRADGMVAIDLHWAFVPSHYSFSPDAELLWERLEEVCLNDRTVMTISPEDLLLVLCIHGGKHYWEQINWICDVAEMIRTHEGLNWEAVIEGAEELNIERMLCLGLLLANDILGAVLPEEVLQRVQSDPMIKSLACQVHRMILPDEDVGIRFCERHLFYLRLMENFADRRRYFLDLFIKPTPLEWQLVSLPVSLSFLYYLVRPVRLIGKHVLSFFR